jgi:foldase protein PrsA
MNISVSDAEVQQRVDQIKKQYFGGSEKRYRAALAQQHYTDASYRDNLKTLLLSQKVFDQVTKGVKVSDADARAYYTAHAGQYTVAQSRLVRHILVKSKALAETLYAQLKSGNDSTWCALAKKYSQDPSSKATCGKLLPDIKKGATVPPFDKVAFSEKTNVVAPPVQSQFGWHVIEPIGPVKPASKQAFSAAKASIVQQLLQNKKNQAMTDWVNSVTKEFCGSSKLKYQTGYQPSPDPCTAVTTSTTTTN